MAFPTPLWVEDLEQAIDQHSDWDGIIEIESADGCPTQAWSAACMLELLYDFGEQ